MSNDAELQVECPNGCASVIRLGSICFCCYGRGFISQEKARKRLENIEREKMTPSNQTSVIIIDLDAPIDPDEPLRLGDKPLDESGNT